MEDLSNKRVFITGGAQGIGAALVRDFVKQGCRVAFCDIDRESGEELGQKENCLFFHTDVVDVSALENNLDFLFEKWGDLDVIVNNVGIFEIKPITTMTVSDFDRLLDVNLRPVFLTARKWALHRELYPSALQYGRMINLCSTRYLMSEADTLGYSASKGGIYSLTHSLAISLAPYYITVNSISPGWVQTTHYDTLKLSDHAQHPSRRVGRPEDISRMALFLSHPENNFVNGENITVDGGMTRKMIYEE